MVAIAGFSLALVGAIAWFNPDRPHRTVTAIVAPIEPAPPQAAPLRAPPSLGPSLPASEPATAAASGPGVADVSVENGVKVIRLNPVQRADGGAGMTRGVPVALPTTATH